MDKVEKVTISKRDVFYFSWKYDKDAIEKLLDESRRIYAKIIDIPVLPSVLSRIEEDVIRRAIFGTAALEGNPLSEQAVGKILAETDKTTGIQRAEQEIINLTQAYEVIRGSDPCEVVIPEHLIQFQHRIIMNNINNAKPGEYRTEVCRVGDKDHGGTYKPPTNRNDIQTLMKYFIRWINKPELCKTDPFIRAALAHFHLGRIHPFEDGNGRTARVIEAMMMTLSGFRFIPIMQSNYYYRHSDDYCRAFSLAGKNKKHDMTPFLKFACKGVIESLNTIKDGIYNFVNHTVLKEYYNILHQDKTITQRQYDFLSIVRGDKIEQFSFQELFTTTKLTILYRPVSERTARRDIARLIGLNLLKKAEGDAYQLNFDVLKLMRRP